MKVEGYKVIRINIELTEKEAKWLKDYLQNWPYPDQEEVNPEYRENLFNAIRSQGIV